MGLVDLYTFENSCNISAELKVSSVSAATSSLSSRFLFLGAGVLVVRAVGGFLGVRMNFLTCQCNQHDVNKDINFFIHKSVTDCSSILHMILIHLVVLEHEKMVFTISFSYVRLSLRSYGDCLITHGFHQWD